MTSLIGRYFRQLLRHLPIGAKLSRPSKGDAVLDGTPCSIPAIRLQITSKATYRTDLTVRSVTDQGSIEYCIPLYTLPALNRRRRDQHAWAKRYHVMLAVCSPHGLLSRTRHAPTPSFAEMTPCRVGAARAGLRRVQLTRSLAKTLAPAVNR